VGTIALLAALIWVLLRVRAVLVVLLGAVLLAALLEPAVAAAGRIPLGRRRLGRRTAAALVVLLALAVLAVVVYVGVPPLWRQVSLLAQDLPGRVSLARQKLEGLLQNPALFPAGISESFEAEVSRLLAEAGRHAAGWVVALALNVIQILGYVVVPLGAFYILADGDRLRRDMLGVLPPAWRPWTVAALGDIGWVLSAYVRGQTAVCVSAAVLYAVLFSVLGLPYAIALGALAGLAEAIPFLGSLLVVVTVGITGLASGVDVAARCLVGYVAGNQIVNYVISPRLLSKQLDLHPFYVILAALAGASLAGPGGALLALPAAAVAQTLVHRQWSAARPPATEPGAAPAAGASPPARPTP
jgi:predicted PurR-regulated permease PerM